MRPGFLAGCAFFCLKSMYFHQGLILTFSPAVYIYIHIMCVCTAGLPGMDTCIYIYTHLKNDIDHLTIVYGKLCFDTFLYCHTTITPTGKHSKLSCVKFETITRAKFTIIWFPHHLLKLLI